MFQLAFRATLLFSCPFSFSAEAGVIFEPNRGQTDPAVRYLARTSEGVVFLTDQYIVLHRGSADSRDTVRISFGIAGAERASAESELTKARWEESEPTGRSVSYMIGRDPNQWIRGLQYFKRIVRREVAPGVDLALYGAPEKGSLEYDLIVAPGVDPANVRMRVEADGKNVRLDERSGDLLIGDSLRQKRPVLYQVEGNQRVHIKGRFRRISEDEYGFHVARHDRRKALYIDPVIESSRYLGGIGDDSVTAMGVGFVAGTTTSVDFPGTPLSRKGGTDVFIRMSTWTLIIGGSGDDMAGITSYTYGSSGNYALIAGTTSSRDLPTSRQYLVSVYPRTTRLRRRRDGWVSCLFPAV